MLFKQSKWLWSVVLMCALVVLGGCQTKNAAAPTDAGKSGPPPLDPGKNAATPQDACRKMARGMEKNDRDLFLSSVWVGSDAGAKDRAGTFLDSFSTVSSFFTEYQAAYGKDENLDVESIKEADVDSLKFREDGDKATAGGKGGKTITCVKKDGGWLVDMESNCSEENINRMVAMTKACVTVRPQIGKVSKTELDKLLLEKSKAEAAPQ